MYIYIFFQIVVPQPARKPDIVTVNPCRTEELDGRDDSVSKIRVRIHCMHGIRNFGIAIGFFKERVVCPVAITGAEYLLGIASYLAHCI